MASRATRRQAAITTMAMTAAKLAGHGALLSAVQGCVDMIGDLPPREAQKMNRALEAFRKQIWRDGVGLPEFISTLVCLVSDQLIFITGRKRAVFSKLLSEIEALLKIFDADINHKRALRAAIAFGKVKF